MKGLFINQFEPRHFEHVKANRFKKRFSKKTTLPSKYNAQLYYEAS